MLLEIFAGPYENQPVPDQDGDREEVSSELYVFGNGLNSQHRTV